ncbi:carboxylesterase [Fictibacillus macauensis ZFHKF-1]|uniref:Carboxylesterase n=1 Tax=Fictibacillus macauensis ZFHKF-1 TaxID=1196324 RepID=I8UJR5_9BACL|nr:alpha/beta fold hydrolase [Fictibacillus macauensis]EIT87058.1 carboxylesterase [Fictibacillus macauensis ZFHKF-1]
MVGCLCLHGFTGGPFEVQPVADYLRARTDWEIAVPTYPGHGELLHLRGVKQARWVEEAERAFLALRQKHDTLYVVGFSMGGMIAAYLAAKYQCQKVVLLSASAFYLNPIHLQDELSAWLRMKQSHAPHDEWMYKQYWHRVTKTPVSALFQFRKLVKALKPSFSQITAQTLIVQGKKDGLVPLKSAHYIYETIPSDQKKLLYLKDSRHMICHDVNSEELLTEVYTFLQER